MDKMNEERVIYLKDLIFAALYQYKRIFAVALVLALVLGGFMGLRSWKQINAQPYEQAMEAYNAEKASMEEQLQDLQKEIKIQKDYLEKSVLQQLRSYDYYVAELNLYVETNDRMLLDAQAQSLAPGKTDDVIAAYKALFAADEMLEALAEPLKTEPRYVKELVLTERTANGSLTVRVMCPDEAQAAAVKELLEKKLVEMQAQVNAAVCDHRISIVTAAVQQDTDSSLTEKQVQAQNHLQELETAEGAAQAGIAALPIPVPASAQRTQVIKKAVVFGVIGAVLGVFLVVMIAWIGHIAGAKIYSARTLVGHTGISIVGCLNDKPAKKSLMNWLRRLEGRETMDAAVQAVVLAAHIGSRLDGAKQLLITGTTSAEQRKLLEKALQEELPQVQIVDLGCIMENAQAMRALSESDAVILVEQCHKSRYIAALRQASLVKNCGKTFLGCVLLGG